MPPIVDPQQAVRHSLLHGVDDVGDVSLALHEALELACPDIVHRAVEVAVFELLQDALEAGCVQRLLALKLGRHLGKPLCGRTRVSWPLPAGGHAPAQGLCE